MCYRNSDTVTAYKPDRTVAKHRTHRCPAERGCPPATGPQTPPERALAPAGLSGRVGGAARSVLGRLLRAFSHVHHISLSLNGTLWQREHDPLREKAFRAVCRKTPALRQQSGLFATRQTRARVTGREPSAGLQTPGPEKEGRAVSRGLGDTALRGQRKELSSLLAAGASGEAKDRGPNSSMWDVAGQKAPLLALKPRACYSLPQHPFHRPPRLPPAPGPTALPSGTMTPTRPSSQRQAMK